MADCLIVGFNDLDFREYEARVRRMGTGSGAYQDLGLSFVRHRGRPLRALDTINHFHPGRHLHNADFLWPVLLVLGSSLHRRGHTFDYVNLPHLERGRLREKLAAADLRAIALTSTLYTEPQPLTELVAFVRAHRPDVPIVIGGPYIAGQARALGAEALAEQLLYLGADVYVISAEGEWALGDLVGALKTRAPLDLIDNLAFRCGERIVFTNRSTEYNSLAKNRVDYSLFPRGDFGQFVTTRTAKSCPFRCAFCGFPERAGDYTYLSVADVEQEFDAIAALGGVTTLTIIDDTFNVPKTRFKDLLRMMARKRYGFRWNSFFRCDHADDETIVLMAAAGCEGVILGVESGSDQLLALMNKTARRSHYLWAIPRLEAAGIACYASLIVGFPGETEETVAETIELIETTRPSYFRAQLWYADPITAVYRDRARHGLRGEGFQWSHRTMDVEEACRHIERLFLCVNNSIWQPQAGFEFWSTFYLQRHGMERARVQAFLRSFNAAVKEKILRPRAGAELSPARARDLARLGRLEGPPGDCACEAPPLSGGEYCLAERDWAEAVHALHQDQRAENVAPAEPAFSTAGAGGCAAGSDELAAALAALSAGLHGGREVLLLAQDGAEPELLPLAVRVEPELCLSDLAARVAAARAWARRHRAFGLPLLRRWLAAAPFGLSRPRFDGAVLEGESAWQATIAEFPDLDDEIQLVLLRGEDGVVRVRTRLGAATTARLADAARALLGERHAVRLGELLVADAEPTFDFR
jgi:radical SAM PhpK family P-methyltransferase